MLMCENDEMQSKYPAPQLIIFSFVGDKKIWKKIQARGFTLICKDSKWYNSTQQKQLAPAPSTSQPLWG